MRALQISTQLARQLVVYDERMHARSFDVLKVWVYSGPLQSASPVPWPIIPDNVPPTFPSRCKPLDPDKITWMGLHDKRAGVLFARGGAPPKGKRR